MKLPNGHQTIMPYLILNEAEKFTDFVRTVFDGKESHRTLREDNKTRMHSEIQINGSTIMYTEASEIWKQQTANLFIYVENAENTFNKAINAGAKIIRPLADQEYGRTCGVQDSFGNSWWITSL